MEGQAMIDWMIEAVSFGGCNCDYGCPCQFERQPSLGHCRGFEVGRFERGHFADLRLDGLHYAVLYAWPGAIFEGDGSLWPIIDERADAAQRQALACVLLGGETDEARTHWWVYRATSSTLHEPAYKPFRFEVDIARRHGRVAIPGVLEASGRAIRGPATGEEHRVRHSGSGVIRAGG
jgi:hypothetical protein